MKADALHAIDKAALQRPWKWDDGVLLWNEEVDHCVLAHGGAQWPVSPENRAAIETALNHMPALIALVAACERRQGALEARRAFAALSLEEGPFSFLTSEYEEHVEHLEGVLHAANREIDTALVAVHAVVPPSP